MDPTDRNNFIELLNGADQLKWTACSSHDIKRFSKNEIEKITDNYKTTVGQGAFGKVYAGILEDKSMVAVKILDHNISKMRECFAKEIIVHSQINHRNVTRLIGYCMEGDALVMVTEYIPNGNLENILHQDVRPISLDTRLRIAMECAGALAYMHSQMYTRVIHGDIKPANILLSQNLSAKISDFGISRLVNTDMSLYTTYVIGSIGYMDPLFVRTGCLTPKSDVYSFGVVLLEMFTRKKVKADHDGGLSLVDGFIRGLSRGFRRVREMFDAEISDSSSSKILDGIAKLIGECLSMEIQKRPEMTNVAERLQALRKALHQGQERVGLFFWGRKTKPDSAAEKTTIPVKRTFRAGQRTMVVMKRVKPDLSEQDFRHSVAVISDLRSDLVMPLRWYHCSKSDRLLVYHYMPMGSLAALLHGKNGSASAGGQVNWEWRSSIALTVARAVAAIHSAGPASCHGNIKSSNVFLTGDHEVRLSEHGLHTLVGMYFSAGAGPSGYRAPEVTLIDRDTTRRSDVYSFGVLLLELLTGRCPTNMLVLHKGHRVDLPRWVRLSVLSEDSTTKVLDADIIVDQQQENQMQQLMRLAMVCCEQIAIRRPAMSEVVQRMEEIRRSNSAVTGRGTIGTTWKVVNGDLTGIMIQEDIAFDQYIAAIKSINKELVLKLMQGVDLPDVMTQIR
ncbi:serine/threonine-protein kinase PBL13-like [Panicum virgatum]|uniref:serine/threonine-protein kinase PBL13-like n=1 Tax=Panicum virgatum TaxID=38727 RepID=UPI0019D65E96|nr:serine/threonine-protein kinase PBL13-like [Panicum virgatum]